MQTVWNVKLLLLLIEFLELQNVYSFFEFSLLLIDRAELIDDLELEILRFL
jgi:hypothetical protein